MHVDRTKYLENYKKMFGAKLVAAVFFIYMIFMLLAIPPIQASIYEDVEVDKKCPCPPEGGHKHHPPGHHHRPPPHGGGGGGGGAHPPAQPPIIQPPIISPPVIVPSPPCPPGGGGGGQKPKTCPINAVKLGLCVDVLSGLVHIGIGNPVVNVCCPVIQGLLELEAAICLCTALRLKLLNLNIFVPIALQVLAQCGLTPPPGFVCPPIV